MPNYFQLRESRLCKGYIRIYLQVSVCICNYCVCVCVCGCECSVYVAPGWPLILSAEPFVRAFVQLVVNSNNNNNK